MSQSLSIEQAETDPVAVARLRKRMQKRGDAGGCERFRLIFPTDTEWHGLESDKVELLLQKDGRTESTKLSLNSPLLSWCGESAAMLEVLYFPAAISREWAGFSRSNGADIGTTAGSAAAHH